MLRDFPLADRVAQHATCFCNDLEAEPADAVGGRPIRRVPTVEPRPASTVALLRDGADGPETFLLRRAASMAFAARMHVFPGGGLDPRDLDVDPPWAGPSPSSWAEALAVDEARAAGLLCAAVRELFEESGVLLAGPESSTVVDVTDRSWERDRLALLDRTVALSELFRRRGLLLRSDLLRPWAHWCTPVFEPRRYDTWFFVAALPEGQQARHVGGESDHTEWVPAGAALAQAEGGEVALMPPTRVTLEEIATFPDVASVLSSPRRVARVLPWLARPRSGEEVVIRVDLDGRGGGRPGPASGLEVLA
jgi:8-oxo-dGTP pyrophosphatase MutT (NUDIX family)